MKQNEGNLDRVIRLGLGLGLIAGAAMQNILWLGILGGVIFLTGLIGWCGAYTLLGINTCPVKKVKKSKKK